MTRKYKLIGKWMAWALTVALMTTSFLTTLLVVTFGDLTDQFTAHSLLAIFWLASLVTLFYAITGRPIKYFSNFMAGVIVLFVYSIFYSWGPGYQLPAAQSAELGTTSFTLWPALSLLAIWFLAVNHTLVSRYIYLPFVPQLSRSRENPPPRWVDTVWLLAATVVVALFILIIAEHGLTNLLSSSIHSVWQQATGPVTWILIAIAGICLWLFVNTQRKRKRQMGLHFAFERLSQADKQELLEKIENVAKRKDFYYVYLKCEQIAPDHPSLLTATHCGGIPYMESPADWPQEPDCITRFLVQVRLSAPGLGPVWRDRLIVVYIVDDKVVIRSYAEADTFKALHPNNTALSDVCLRFHRLAIPMTLGDDAGPEHPLAYHQRELLAHEPDIRYRLEAISDDPMYTLGLLLSQGLIQKPANVACFMLEGGHPKLTHQTQEAYCPVCDKAMRFLIQFGNSAADHATGKLGQINVYGCDDHPDQCHGVCANTTVCV